MAYVQVPKGMEVDPADEIEWEINDEDSFLKTVRSLKKGGTNGNTRTYRVAKRPKKA